MAECEPVAAACRASYFLMNSSLAEGAEAIVELGMPL